jgi:hypothetical protein
MRTTLALNADAMEAVKTYGRDNGVSLGKAASELILRGSRYQVRLGMRNGFPVFDVPPDFPVITTELVRELLDEE